MRNPAAFSVQQPRLVLLATLLCVAFGALSYAGLPRQENPRLPDRFLTVTTYLPGAEPEKVELLVSKVLEERIAQVDDLDEIFSNSSDGRSYMIVQVERGAPYADRLEQVLAANPVLDYEGIYDRNPSWTKRMFVEAVYRDLSQSSTQRTSR